MEKLELLAPAGNLEALRAAIINGADAVYLGLKNYSARANADNFNISELQEAVELSHLYGVKVYVAVNTLIKDDEFNSVIDIILKAYKNGVDAFIVQDLALVKKLKLEFPFINIHASTQMGVHNYLGAKAAQRLGIKRVILSRETTLEDIKLIRDNTNLEIEAFVHGALCVSFSGNCYFSSLVSALSGNRGRCLQLCRKKYTIIYGQKKNKGYYLSPKDLCLLADLKALIDAGVTSFKIEGRMRRTEYISEAVRIYKSTLNSITSNKNDENNFIEMIERLKLLYNRGEYTNGHLFNSTNNIVFPSVQSHIGVTAGVVQNVSESIAKLSTATPLSKGDGIKFLRDGLEVGSALISSDDNKTTFVGNIKKGDEVRLTTNKILNERILQRTRKIVANAKAEFLINKLPSIKLTYDNLAIEIVGDEIIEEAKNSPVKKEQIKSILQSESDKDIVIQVEDLKCCDNIFIPIRSIKGLKNNAIIRFKNELINYHQNSFKSSSMSDIIPKIEPFKPIFDKEHLLFVQTDNINNLTNKILQQVNYIIYSPNYYDLSDIKSFFNNFKERAILSLPNIARGKDIGILDTIVKNSGIKNFVVNNIYGLEMCKDKGIIFGAFMNMLGTNHAIPNFINSVEAEGFSKNGINIIYSKFPLMTLTHCPKKQESGSCESKCRGYGNISLTDELNNKFSLERVKIDNCYSRVINSVPIYLADLALKFNVKKRLIDISYHNATQADAVFDMIANGDKPKKFTRGNYNKTLK